MLKKVEFVDKERCVHFDFANGNVVFRNFRVEGLLPKKVPELIVSFDEIGKNTVSHFNSGTQPFRGMHAVQTLKGRIWIPESYPNLSEVIDLLDALWKENAENRTKEERKAFNSQINKTHPVTKVVGATLLLIGLFVVIYYFVEFLPNLKV